MALFQWCSNSVIVCNSYILSIYKPSSATRVTDIGFSHFSTCIAINQIVFCHLHAATNIPALIYYIFCTICIVIQVGTHSVALKILDCFILIIFLCSTGFVSWFVLCITNLLKTFCIIADFRFYFIFLFK